MEVKSIVWPSAGASTTASVAILPPAPVRFSMTNGWPSRSDSHCPKRRARMSGAPPAANPTMMRTGRDGYGCALATRVTVGSAVAAAARCIKFRREGFIAATPSRAQLLFDHLVGGHEQAARDFYAERLGSLEVQHRLELGRRLHR